MSFTSRGGAGGRIGQFNTFPADHIPSGVLRRW